MIQFLSFLIGCFENVVLVNFLDVYLHRKNTYAKYIFIVILIIGQNIINTFDNPLLLVIPVISFIIYSFLNYEGTLLKKLYYPLFIFVTFLLTNLVVLVCYSYTTVGTYSELLQTTNDRFVLSFLSKFIFFFLYLIFKRSTTNRELNLAKEGLVFCFASLLTIFSLLLISLLVLKEDSLSKSKFIYIIIIILIMYCFFYYFYLNSEKRNKELVTKSIHLNMLENNALFVNELQQVYEQNRRLNHDMKNHLVTIKGSIEDNRYKEAIEYIDSLYERIISVPFVNTDNEVFNYIVNSKVAIMQEAFIEFYYNIADSLGFMDAIDTSSIIGNLLDNAIEAQTYVTGKKYIYLTTIRKGNVIILEVKNSFHKESLKVSNGSFLTRKKDRLNHGLGLENIRSHLYKYNGELEVIMEDNDFIVNIMLIR